jgi:hypothetical protein
VANDGNGSVLRIDPTSVQVTDEITINRPQGLAARDDAVWVGAGPTEPGNPDVLTRIDATTLEIMAEVPLPDAPVDDGIEVGDAGVWVLLQNMHLVEVDAATNQVVAETPIDGQHPRFAVDDDAVWVSPGGQRQSRLQRIAADSGEITTIDLARDLEPSASEGVTLGPVTTGGGAAWVLRQRVSTEPTVDPDLCRVDREARDYACVELPVLSLTGGDRIDAIAIGEGALWATVETDATTYNDQSRVARIAPEPLDITTVFEFRTQVLLDLAVGEGAAWTTRAYEGSESAASVTKIPA